MLGPSALILGVPLTILAAVLALRDGRDPLQAWIGLGLTAAAVASTFV